MHTQTILTCMQLGYIQLILFCCLLQLLNQGNSHSEHWVLTPNLSMATEWVEPLLNRVWLSVVVETCCMTAWNMHVGSLYMSSYTYFEALGCLCIIDHHSRAKVAIIAISKVEYTSLVGYCNLTKQSYSVVSVQSQCQTQQSTLRCMVWLARLGGYARISMLHNLQNISILFCIICPISVLLFLHALCRRRLRMFYPACNYKKKSATIKATPTSDSIIPYYQCTQHMTVAVQECRHYKLQHHRDSPPQWY